MEMKKKNSINIIPAFILFLGFVSCNPAEQYKTELSEIDSSLQVIDSLEMLFDGIEFDSLKLMAEHVINNEKQIKLLYKPDTLDENLGKLMNESKTVRKKLGNVQKDQVAFGDELNAVKNQFKDLKADILEGLYDDQQIEEYLNVEKAALNKVFVGFTGFHKMQIGEKGRYYHATPLIDEYIQNLKSKNDIGD